MKQPALFEGARLQMTDSIRLTIESLQTYGPRHRHWAIAWSGGKDSTALLTLVVYLLGSGRIPKPETLTVLYADTRLELLPLWISAQEIREELAERGIEVRIVMAPLDKRFLVYLLGRGVPPPNNNTSRWCTRQIKVDPMTRELEKLASERGVLCVLCKGSGKNQHETPEDLKEGASRLDQGVGTAFDITLDLCPECKGSGRRHEKVLVLTGVRRGESVTRDNRIALSCAKDGAECGQGWYQQTLPESLTNTLAPIDHWRVCHVWEWLKHWAPQAEFGDWSTALLAEAYGGDEAEESQARTGCVGCPLATHDTALDALLKKPQWAYLFPLKELRPLWRELRLPAVRLRKRDIELRKDGTPGKNPQRMGPVIIEPREEALWRVLDIQHRINEAAREQGRPVVDLLNEEEVVRICELLEARTYPNKWNEDIDALATEILPSIYSDGSSQPLLFVE
jgi:DNA sulfur modification protein DndC